MCVCEREREREREWVSLTERALVAEVCEHLWDLVLRDVARELEDRLHRVLLVVLERQDVVDVRHDLLVHVQSQRLQAQSKYRVISCSIFYKQIHVYLAAFEKGAKKFWSRPWFRLGEIFGCFLPLLVTPLPSLVKSKVKTDFTIRVHRAVQKGKIFIVEVRSKILLNAQNEFAQTSWFPISKILVAQQTTNTA